MICMDINLDIIGIINYIGNQIGSSNIVRSKSQHGSRALYCAMMLDCAVIGYFLELQ